MAQGQPGFERLKYLIIDDFANFCSALRSMLQSFGAQDVDVVSNGDDALRALNSTRYDVVLCDYNLGEGRNGNDVLEEAKHRHLLKSGSLYLMITAENTGDMVRGALEYQPDDYLTKPFTKEVLQTRLQRLLDRNRSFNQVFSLREKGELLQAAAQCEQIASEHGRYAGFALKQQAELLIAAEAFDQAAELYRQILTMKNLPWAKLGLGKSYFLQELYEQAAECFAALVQEDAGYVQAWDWLARCQEQLGDLEAAQEALQSAVKVSPMNIRRQNHLGELALKNGDAERAEMAYGRAVKIGKHSVYREPDTYLKLSELLVEKVKGAEGLSRKNAELKALGTMDELRQIYRSDPEVQLRSRLVEHKVHTASGKEGDADQALAKAYDLCQKDEEGKLGAEFKEQLIEQLEERGRNDLVDKLVHAMQQEESNHNRQAVEFYDQGDIKSALKVLQLAVREKPRSYAVNLNLAQVAMHHIVKFGVDSQLLAQAGAALERVAGIGEQDSRYKLFHNLQERYRKLQQRTQGGGA